jgi:4-alpha-glucanotransferase
MESAGLRVWQVLPLVPPEDKYWSPYSSTDAKAGNVLMIAVEELVEMGLLSPEDLPPQQPVADADFPAVMAWKAPLLKKAALTLLNGVEFEALRANLAAFRSSNPWVEDSAIFEALTRSEELGGLIWWDWPQGLRDRDPAALSEARAKLKEDVEVFVVLQFFFEMQWKALKAYANSKGVSLLGDMPIYVSGHCVDVWANQEKFILTEDKKPSLVRG